ncbi:hypothetical protein LEP1GSC166_2422 [Leptospira kirschneri]|nr:hypothetical protein LEP1GSC166_2422 [Leptospira kirschneri]
MDGFWDKFLFSIFTTTSKQSLPAFERFFNRVVEKLILYLLLFHRNGRLKQFC